MKILFLCVANSARSQMAEGLARKILGPAVEIQSAGSVPSGQVHPRALDVMKTLGIDLSHHRSKSIDDLPADFIDDLDYAITLCADEICPVVLSDAKKLHWAFPDPAAASPEEQMASFSEIRDQISAKIVEFKNLFV